MNAFLYAPVYFYAMSILFFVIGLRYAASHGYYMQEKGNPSLILPVAITLILTVWLGNRPISGAAFGDTFNYALSYQNMDASFLGIDWHGEWLWQWIMCTCKAMGFSVSNFFTVVEMGYMTSALVAVAIILPRNPLLAMLFFWDSLMFFTFGTNGLRNGLACNIVLVFLALMLQGHKVSAFIVGLIAFAIHRSTFLPIVAIICSMTYFTNPKYGVYFWMASIVVSLFAGGAATGFFSSLGFDDRMTAYTSGEYEELHEGRFRWDFLLYSAIPVFFGWYICIKRQIRESWYDVMFNAYCLANAFWVLVIRSSFSNRFAYLSWFMYPLLIAYPIIMLPLWNDQDAKISAIIILYIVFTLIMQLMWGYI